MSHSPGSTPLFRPTPIRPYNIDFHIREATPPEEEEEEEDLAPSQPRSDLNMEWLNQRLLDTGAIRRSESSSSIRRAQSVKNLTASALTGIFGSLHDSCDKLDTRTNGTITPWEPVTATATSDRDWMAGESAPIVQKPSAYPVRRRSSASHTVYRPPPSTTNTLLFGALRASLLSGLGIVYGIGMATVHGDKTAATPLMIRASTYGWGYLAFWGAAGLVLGYLLPWFDTLWEQDHEQTNDNAEPVPEEIEEKNLRPHTDWALAVRGVGILIGIAYAIRKLEWNSTLQVSLSLALVNSGLWAIIDRSMPGFIVSSAVGLAGSALLTSIQPDVVPTPAMISSSAPYSGIYGTATNHPNSSLEYAEAAPMLLGGLASQQTLATGIWTLNVLFCCTVVLGNVGRWLAIDKYSSRRS